jgi:hypothetical protein
MSQVEGFGDDVTDIEVTRPSMPRVTSLNGATELAAWHGDPFRVPTRFGSNGG